MIPGCSDPTTGQTGMTIRALKTIIIVLKDRLIIMKTGICHSADTIREIMISHSGSHRNKQKEGRDQPRQFEHRDDNNRNWNAPVRQPDTRSNDQPQRQPPQQIERRQDQPRQFERRDDNNRNWNAPVRQPDTRSNDQPQRQPPQQIERRQDQPRQFERRDDGNNRQNPGERNNRNGFSRNRF